MEPYIGSKMYLNISAETAYPVIVWLNVFTRISYWRGGRFRGAPRALLHTLPLCLPAGFVTCHFNPSELGKLRPQIQVVDLAQVMDCQVLAIGKSGPLEIPLRVPAGWTRGSTHN